MSVQGSLFQRKNVVAGENYSVEIQVYNASDNPTEILIIQKDYKWEGGHRFPKARTEKMSNSAWIKIEHPRMLLPAQRKTDLSFLVKVPEGIEAGSYYSILAIRTQPRALKTGKITVGLATETNIQVISDVQIDEAKKELKVLKIEVEENKLILTIKNVENVCLTFKIIPPIPDIQSKRTRLYPSNKRTVELDISKLSDGEYKELRFILDNGKDFIQPVFISFRKGEEPEKKELYALKGESLERAKIKARSRSFRPRVNLILSAGTEGYRSASLSGSLALFKNLISFRGGSNYREFSTLLSNKMLTHRLGTSLNLKNLRINYSAYFFEDSVFEMAGASYNYRSFQSHFNYAFDRKILQGSISQRFWKRWNLRVYGHYDLENNRNRTIASISIPIL